MPTVAITRAVGVRRQPGLAQGSSNPGDLQLPMYLPWATLLRRLCTSHPSDGVIRTIGKPQNSGVLSNAQNIGCGIHLALVADFVWQPSPCRASTCIMKNDCEPTGRKPKVPQSAVELLIWPCMSSPMQFRKQSTTIQLTQRPGNPMTLSSSSLHCCQRALATPSRKPQRLRKSNTRKVTLEAALVKAMAEGSNVYWSTPVRLREP